MRFVHLPAALLCTLLVAACASSRPLTPEDTVTGLNQRLVGQPVRVVMADGSQAAGVGFRVEADSASWIEPGTGHVGTAAVDDVLRVESFSRRRGARRGARWGLVVGGAVGVAVSILTVDDDNLLLDAMGGGLTGRIYWTTFAAGNYGAVGAGTGALVGLAVGDRKSYDVQVLRE